MTTLPGVPVPLSRLVLGTMTFGDTVDADGAASMVDAALDAGITGIDTANAYAGGKTEEILADLLRSRRDRVVLATKAGMPHPDAGEHALLSPAAVRASVEGSLRRLGTDQIDLFYLHQPDRATPVVDTLTTVADLVAEGKVLALGVSNYAAWQIAELTHVAERVGAPDTGRFGDSRLAEMYRGRYWDARLFAAIEQLAEIAAGAGIGLAELSLRWLLDQPDVNALLLGGSRVEHLRANLAAAAAGPLPEDVRAACAEVGVSLRGPMPAYNR